MMTSTFSIKTQPVDVLFDSDATHSFISAKLVGTLRLVPMHRTPLLSVTLPNGKTVKRNELCKGCPSRCMNTSFKRTYINLS